MNSDNFLAELKRRNVYKVAVAYAVVAWLGIQVASIVLPAFHAPEWTLQTIIALVAIGFPIALVIAWAFELTPEGIKRTDDVDPAASARQPWKHAWVFVVAVGAVCSVGLFFVGRYTAQNTPAPGLHEPVENSIAVLPFENAIHDANTEYLSDGISEALINSLTELQQLKVIARSTAFQYRGKQADPQATCLKCQPGLLAPILGSIRFGIPPQGSTLPETLRRT